VTVDIGWHDAFTAEPSDVLAKHVAWLGLQLDSVRGHSLSLSIRSEPAQASDKDDAAGAETGGQDVDVADLERFGRLDGAADNLPEAGGEHTQDGVPGQARDVSADQHEAGGGVDDAEDTGQDQPGRERSQCRGEQRLHGELFACGAAYACIAGSSMSSVR